MASGLFGLGIAMTIGMGPGIANAESVGGHESATVIRAGKVAGVATKKTGKAFGFTGSAGTKTFRLSAANAAASTRVGRGDDASMPIGLGALFSRKPETKSAGMTQRPYRAQIAKHAKANGVPVALAMAVVRVESNYNPRVRGSAGEIGLMQIKPQTARGMGFSGSSKALYDPETNLRWGMKYLAGAYQRAGGDTCGTIMRYQGGHYAKRMSRVAVTYCSKVKRHMAGKWA
jgi:soluble lytic murein transglycosylase-like protein